MDYIVEDDRELQSLLRKTEAELAKARAKEPISIRETRDVLHVSDRYLTQCKQIIARIELETRDMEPEDRSAVRQVLRSRAGKVKEMKNEYKWVEKQLEARVHQDTIENEEKENNNNENNNDHESTGSNGRKKNKKNKKGNDSDSSNSLEKYRNYNNIDEMGRTVEEKEKKLMDYGRKIQEEDMNILDRVIINVDQTKETASAAAEKVHDQTAQIQRIHDTLGDIDGELDRAKKIMTTISRRMLTDKILWFFLMLIFISIVLVILFETGIIKKGTDSVKDNTNLN